MGSVLTSSCTAAHRARQSVELTRAQVLGIAVLIVVPLPAFSLGALVVPLPQLMERAAAGFIPFGSPEIEAPPPRAVRRAPAAPREGRATATAKRPVASSRSSGSVRPRNAPARSEQKQTTPPVAAPVKAAPTAPSATAAVAPEPPAPQEAPAESSALQSAVLETPSSRPKPGKRSGSEKKTPEPKGPTPSAAPPANSAPGANSGHGGDGGLAGGSSESNAGGNGNGNASGNDNSGNGGGSGKDGH